MTTKSIRTMRKLLQLSVFLLPIHSFAGGGSIVGNGAGIVENNFQFVYMSLENTIGECFLLENCKLSEHEKDLLGSISVIIRKNSTKAKNIYFISENDFPGFFDTGINEKHRIAKTGLTPESPIYINIDLVYSSEGKPAIDQQTIAALLVHEIGHQTGEVDHAALDILGAKIKLAFDQKLSRHSLLVGGLDDKFEISILNQKYPILAAEIFVGFENTIPKNITAPLVSPLSCTNKQADISGFEFFNGHFIGVTKVNEKVTEIQFGLWINISCYDKASDLISIESKNVEFIINENMGIEVTKIEGFIL